MYGGTKKEMERLLADANEINRKAGKMTDYQLDNLSDVFEAIHVVQEELGVTGTTAQEASETISGSLGMVKSAWENLLTGIADDNADFETLVDNFVESVGIAFDNIAPRFEIALEGIGTLIDELMPTIAAKIPEIIAEQLPQMVTVGMNIIVALIEGISNNSELIVQSLITVMGIIFQTIMDNLPTILQAALEIILALAQGLIDNEEKLSSAIADVIAAIVSFVVKNLPKIIEVGLKLLVALGKGLILDIPLFLSDYVQKVLDAITDGFKGIIEDVIGIGGNIVEGLWNGIKDKVGWIKDKILGFKDDVLDALKKAFGINSPSKLMRDEVGQWLAKGIGVGFEENNPILEIQKSLEVGLKGMERSLFGNTTNTTNNYMTNKFVGYATPDEITRRLRIQQLYGGV